MSTSFPAASTRRLWPGGDRALSPRGGRAAVLPRYRHPVGHDPARRDRGLPALHQSAPAYGLLGLVSSEYSSSGSERRGALTKAGNTHARRVLVEAAWHYRHRRPSARRSPGAVRASRPPSSAKPGTRSNGGIAAIGIWSGMASGRRWPCRPWPGNWIVNHDFLRGRRREREPGTIGEPSR